MIIRPPAFPSIGCDTTQVMDSVRCQGLRAHGISWIYRYLGSLTQAERDVILASGLGLGVVTYSDAPGWVPTASKGSADSAIDRIHLTNAGIPSGVTVQIDLEGVASSAPATDVEAFLNARSQPLVGSAGLYVGAGGGLTAEQLYGLPYIHTYWRSLSRDIAEPSCGWGLIQAFPDDIVVGGTQIDVDYSVKDYQGRQPLLLWAA